VLHFEARLGEKAKGEWRALLSDYSNSRPGDEITVYQPNLGHTSIRYAPNVSIKPSNAGTAHLFYKKRLDKIRSFIEEYEIKPKCVIKIIDSHGKTYSENE
jgi:hypothetical protein